MLKLKKKKKALEHKFLETCSIQVSHPSKSFFNIIVNSDPTLSLKHKNAYILKHFTSSSIYFQYKKQKRCEFSRTDCCTCLILLSSVFFFFLSFKITSFFDMCILCVDLTESKDAQILGQTFFWM